MMLSKAVKLVNFLKCLLQGILKTVLSSVVCFSFWIETILEATNFRFIQQIHDLEQGVTWKTKFQLQLSEASFTRHNKTNFIVNELGLHTAPRSGLKTTVKQLAHALILKGFDVQKIDCGGHPFTSQLLTYYKLHK